MARAKWRRFHFVEFRPNAKSCCVCLRSTNLTVGLSKQLSVVSPFWPFTNESHAPHNVYWVVSHVHREIEFGKFSQLFRIDECVHEWKGTSFGSEMLEYAHRVHRKLFPASLRKRSISVNNFSSLSAVVYSIVHFRFTMCHHSTTVCALPPVHAVVAIRLNLSVIIMAIPLRHP